MQSRGNYSFCTVTEHLDSSSLPLVRWRLAQLASHLVVALIALVVIGGATRVMEAGLACPDWPLCYGSFLPGRQMNVQVFLEWFHRLDAFFVGIFFLIQFAVAFLCKSQLPKWLVWTYGFGLFLVVIQGGLGGLTVLHLLPSVVVTGHLALALILVALMSATSQRLLQLNCSSAPLWWRFMGFTSLLLVTGQCLIGGRMATTWSSHLCIEHGKTCELLELHMISAIPVALVILTFVITSLFAGGWTRNQWPFLSFVFLLLASQISLGIMSVQLHLSEAFLTVGHQLIAALLVASLAALTFRRPDESLSIIPEPTKDSIWEACHG